MRVLVRLHRERDALVEEVAPGEPVELRPHHLEHRQVAVVRDRQGLPQPIVHLDTGGQVEGGRGNPRAQRLEHRVATGHQLVAGGLPTNGGRRALRLAALRREPFGGLLALVSGVVLAVLRLRCRAAALERLAPVATRADGGTLLAPALACGSACLSGHRCSISCRRRRPRARRPRRRGRRAPGRPRASPAGVARPSAPRSVGPRARPARRACGRRPPSEPRSCGSTPSTPAIACTAATAWAAVPRSPASIAWLPRRIVSCSTASASGTPRSSSMAAANASGTTAAALPAPASAARSTRRSMREIASSASTSDPSWKSRSDR